MIETIITFLSDKKKLIFYLIAIISLLIIIIISANQLIRIYGEYNASKKEYNNLRKQYVEEETRNEETVSVEEAFKQTEMLQIDFVALSEINSDLIGWIHFENIDISYPIVQTDNNNFYIEHSFNKENNRA